MSWCGLEGHDDLVERFRCAIRQGRLASTFLFVGPAGVGKRQFALRLAQAMLCQTRPETALDPCGQCPACLQVLAGSHPDVERVGRPAGKSTIPLDLLVGNREHRAQEGLCHWISLKPSSGKRRIAIIDDADYLGVEAANSLLKTLEEPPPGAILILIGTSQQRQLPTIRSRCQVVRFRPLPDEVVASIVRRENWTTNDDQAANLVALAGGSLDQARAMADSELLRFADSWLSRWQERVAPSPVLAKELHGFVDGSGKDAPTRRDTLRRVIELIIRNLREQFLAAVQQRSSGLVTRDETLERTLDQCERRLDRCLEALREIDANANLATLAECFVDDLM